MVEKIITDVASPHTLANIVAVLLALFARDVVVGLLRAVAKKVKEDRDPGNDWLADAALVVVNALIGAYQEGRAEASMAALGGQLARAAYPDPEDKT